MGIMYNVTKDDPEYKALIKKHSEDWRKVSKAFYGEYVPLTEWSNDTTSWIAWQFMDVETGCGAIQAYRREKCAEPSLTVKLYGIEAESTYEFEIEGKKKTYYGAELLNGYTIELPPELLLRLS